MIEGLVICTVHFLAVDDIFQCAGRLLYLHSKSNNLCTSCVSDQSSNLESPTYLQRRRRARTVNMDSASLQSIQGSVSSFPGIFPRYNGYVCISSEYPEEAQNSVQDEGGRRA